MTYLISLYFMLDCYTLFLLFKENWLESGFFYLYLAYCITCEINPSPATPSTLALINLLTKLASYLLTKLASYQI